MEAGKEREEILKKYPQGILVASLNRTLDPTDYNRLMRDEKILGYGNPQDIACICRE